MCVGAGLRSHHLSRATMSSALSAKPGVEGGRGDMGGEGGGPGGSTGGGGGERGVTFQFWSANRSPQHTAELSWNLRAHAKDAPTYQV